MPLVVLSMLIALAFLQQPRAAAEARDGLLSLALPDRAWALELRATGVEFDEPQQHGMRIWTSGDALEPSFTVIAIVEISPYATATIDCQEELDPKLARSAWNPDGARRSERNGLSLTEYHIDTYRGMTIDQRNVAAYRFHDGCCIAVKLIEEHTRDAQQGRLERVIDSIRIVESEAVDQPSEPPDFSRSK